MDSSSLTEDRRPFEIHYTKAISNKNLNKGRSSMRRVSIQKVTEDKKGTFVPVGKAYEGWEKEKPALHKPYFVYHDAVFKTSEVASIRDDLIGTRNSVYRLTVIGGYSTDPSKEETPSVSDEEEDTKVTQNLFVLGMIR